MKTKISFDWDGTLEWEYVQKIAELLNRYPNELYIITTRYDNDNLDRYPFKPDPNMNQVIFDTAEEFRIPKERVIFTNMQYKGRTLTELGIDVHFDDNLEELIDAKNYNNNCKVILVQS